MARDDKGSDRADTRFQLTRKVPQAIRVRYRPLAVLVSGSVKHAAANELSVRIAVARDVVRNGLKRSP